MTKKRSSSIQVSNGKKKPAFRDLAIDGVTWWENLSKHENSLTPYLRSASNIVTYYFYLGNQEKAREISGMYSVFVEQEARNFKAAGAYNRIDRFFEAALYRSLSNKPKEADVLWQNLIDFRRDNYPKNKIIVDRTYHIWIYEAYASAKLSQYFKSLELSEKGIQNITSGKATSDERDFNTMELHLGTVLESLASYRLEATSARKEKAQKALLDYKKTGLRYGRLNNYPLIFDLQFSCSDVFTHVLPGSDPDKD